MWIFIIKTNNGLILLRISMVIGSIHYFLNQNAGTLYFLNCKNTSANFRVYILKPCPLIKFLHHSSCITAHWSYVTGHLSLLTAHCSCLSFPLHFLYSISKEKLHNFQATLYGQINLISSFFVFLRWMGQACLA